MRRDLLSGVSLPNAVVSVKAPQMTGYYSCITDVNFSYSAAPTLGRLQIVGSQSNKGYDLDVTAAGAQSLSLGEQGLEFPPGDDVTLTLAAAGAGVIGKVNAQVKWRPLTQQTY